jgi:sigma-B regulation protein RsbU (phosphoserine phosphatase)
VQRAFGRGMASLTTVDGYISLSTRGLPPGQYKITRQYTDGERLWYEEGEADPWSNAHLLNVHEGGFLGDLIRKAYPEIIHNLHLADDPVLGDVLRPFGSLMAVPLFDGGEPLNWGIMLREADDGFSMQDLEETILRGNLIGTSVKNVLNIRELEDANRRIRREMEQIATIQQALLPKAMPKIPGAMLAASYQVFDEAGGDYYDFFPLGGRAAMRIPIPTGRMAGTGPWGVLVADAAGHGPAASVLMAMLHAILHAYPEVPENAAAVLDHANEHLCAKGIESSFVTAMFAIYEPRTHTFRYARAGHPPAILKDPGHDNPVRRLDEVGGVPLGVLPDITFEEATVQLEPGQSVVMYTDGITEAMSPDGTMFGVEGIEHALVRCSGEPECVQDSIGGALLQHESGVRPSDDQTLVVLKVMDTSSAAPA